MDDEPNNSAVWNMDDKENNLIFELKFAFIQSLREWKLENAYWNLDLLLTEVDSLFEKKESEEAEEDMDKLTKYRSDYMINNNSDDKKSLYFIMLRTLYKKICKFIVKNQLYFRKKRAYTGL